MFTISVRLDEKRSTHSQYENKTVGVLLEAQNLELNNSDEILQKTSDLFAMAKAAVEQQFQQSVAPPAPALGNGDQPGRSWNNGSNGHSDGGNGNGRRRTFGRPDPAPTSKQHQLLRRIARDRNIGPERFGEICSRLIGKPINAMDRRDVSRLIEALIEGEAA